MVATVLSIGTSFVVLRFNNLMDYVQMLFSIFHASLFATFLLGMFTSWATPVGALAGLYAVHWRRSDIGCFIRKEY